MKTALIFLFLTSVFFSLSRKTNDVPIFIWSGESYFNGQNKVVSEYLTSESVYSFLESFFKQEDTGSFFQFRTSKKLNPEVFVLFLESKLRTDQVSRNGGALSTLKKLMEKEKCSLYDPYLDLDGSFNPFVVNLAYEAKNFGAKIIYTGQGSQLLQNLIKRVPELQVVKLEEFQEISDIFSNGVTDLVIVEIPEPRFKETDQFIKTVQTNLEEKTSNYIGVYTALEFDYPPSFEFERRAVFEALSNYSISNITENSTESNSTETKFFYFFPGWFWEVFLTLGIMMPTMIGSVFALKEVQVPRMYAANTQTTKKKKNN